MHSQKTKQPYIRSARKNRTRKKKSAVEEDPQKSLKKIKKNEPVEQLKSTESLNIERPQNKPEKKKRAKKKKKVYKTALQIAKNGTPKDTKAKEQAHAEKLTSEWILQRPKQNRTESHQTRTE